MRLFYVTVSFFQLLHASAPSCFLNSLGLILKCPQDAWKSIHYTFSHNFFNAECIEKCDGLRMRAERTDRPRSGGKHFQKFKSTSKRKPTDRFWSIFNRMLTTV